MLILEFVQQESFQERLLISRVNVQGDAELLDRVGRKPDVVAGYMSNSSRVLLIVSQSIEQLIGGVAGSGTCGRG